MSEQNQYPKVIGLYGLPGAGKTTLKDQLEEQLGTEDFVFYDGSKAIKDACEGGMDAFQKLDVSEKSNVREKAITMVTRNSTYEQKTAVITGHYSFWSKDEQQGKPVWNSGDAKAYKLIVYLEVEPERLHERIDKDEYRRRQQHGISELQAWQDREIRNLREMCYANNILFTTITNNDSSKSAILSKVSKLMRDFAERNEASNSQLVSRHLDRLTLQNGPTTKPIDAALIFDGDKTLIAHDTGRLYWQKLNGQAGAECLSEIFDSAMGYSYAGFCQAALLYDQTADDNTFQSYCDSVASEVTIRPELKKLITDIAKAQKIKIFVVTCGLQRIWTKVIELAGLEDHVKVIGSGRYSEDFVVTPSVKAEIVKQLRKKYKAYVWAFGDSETDIPMLRAADEALLIIGKEKRTESTMSAMRKAVDSGLRARQLIMPGVSKTWLDLKKVAEMQIDDLEVAKAVNGKIVLVEATKRPAAQLLATSSRDANLAGAALRNSHFKIGEYLATELLSGQLGVEYFPIPHVTGNTTEGYRIHHEDKTTIVALMRGGEPMAFGVNEVLPQAMFVHAKNPEDLHTSHLQAQSTVILVDSVVNNGETVVQFVKRVRELRPTIQIVVVAGVAQNDAVKADGILEKELKGLGEVKVVALRVSDAKYTGKGKTDTGARLFNTTDIEK